MSDKIGQVRAWYNISSSEPAEPSKGGKGYALPPAVRRAQAKVSTAGGRARCFKCKESFTVNYMQVCSTGTFTEPDWACADCRKQYGLRKVAK